MSGLLDDWCRKRWCFGARRTLPALGYRGGDGCLPVRAVRSFQKVRSVGCQLAKLRPVKEIGGNRSGGHIPEARKVLHNEQCKVLLYSVTLL